MLSYTSTTVGLGMASLELLQHDLGRSLRRIGLQTMVLDSGEFFSNGIFFPRLVFITPSSSITLLLALMVLNFAHQD